MKPKNTDNKVRFTFWGSFADAIENFTQGDIAKYGRMMKIIVDYGIYDTITPDMTPEEQLFFTVVKPNIDNSKQNIKNGETGGRSSSFKKPTIEEIKAYCEERKNKVDAEQFFNFYESKDWQVGKNKMKDWKAAVHTWEKRTEKTAAMNKATGLHSSEGMMF